MSMNLPYSFLRVNASLLTLKVLFNFYCFDFCETRQSFILYEYSNTTKYASVALLKKMEGKKNRSSGFDS